jgi:PrgI family protein
MRFQVPQFIEVEDKLFGPLTLKQFIYLAGSAGIGYIIYTTLPVIIAIPLAVGVVALGAALAFYKPDGHRPFIFMLEQAVRYYMNPKKFVWKQDTTKPKDATMQAKEIIDVKASDVLVPKLSDSKLKELSWSLDIHEKLK